MEAEVLKEIDELKADHGYDFLHHSIPYHIVCQDRWKEFNEKKASETALRVGCEKCWMV